MILSKVMEGVFALNKPSGMTSRKCLDRVNDVLTKADCFKGTMEELRQKRLAARGNRRRRKKDLTNKLKMGHGGTLDPLASGVLILGVGNGTKQLGNFTNDSKKIYDATALLGGSTTTGDAEGQLLETTENEFVTKEDLEKTREKFLGTLEQTPPIFSALKMNGKPLYEYAREGIPLPRDIKPRTVQIYDFQLCEDNLSRDHDYRFLKSESTEDGGSLVDMLKNNPTLNDHDVKFSQEFVEKASKDPAMKDELAAKPSRSLEDSKKYEDESYRAPILHFIATVSSGTYIRSLISDFARALGTSAYMVKLVREKQSDWELGKNCFELSDLEDYPEAVWAPVLEKVLNGGPEIDIRYELEESKKKQAAGEQK